MYKEDISEIYDKCLECRDCSLSRTRTNVVFSDGSVDADIVLIGEAPGEKEDINARPFVGMAGKLMDKYLSNAGISRERDIYITNIVKCRPPKNRKPNTSEKRACFKFLAAQIEAINPKVIVLCGGTALETFFKDKKISEEHGKALEADVNGKRYKMIPIYHPSPLCRVNNKHEVMVKDLKTVLQFLK